MEPAQGSINTEFAFEQVVPAISHELNTALTTVLGNAHILRSRDESLDALTRVEALASIETNAERLFRAVQNLLVYARMELGEQPYLQPLVLPHLLEELVAQERRRVAPREVSLRVEIGARPVAADESMLRVAFRNVLYNACLYSPEDSQVEVLSAEQGSFIDTLVLDRGPGVPEAERELVFQPFYRSPGVVDVKPGIGLGLSVARKLTELHGGSLLLSDRPGGGSVFRFSLPVMTTGDQ
jgi:two-component system sensor histidine kinase KdpD